ncbi:MAG: hypothetical protein QOD86_1585 [Miltoncostaeaceae bacterium]|jgi:hypothetical protein|nr:hypothetical protein [Miltoncostaeaceae bacterium]
MRGRILAALAIALYAAVAVAAVAFAVATPTAGQESDWGSTGVVGVLFLALPGAAFTGVGALMAARRPENGAGRLCVAIGMLWAVVLAASAVGSWCEETGRLGAGEWISWAGWCWVPAVGLMGTHLPLRLPDGRLPSPRWRPFAHACTAGIVVASLVIATEPASGDTLANPTASEPMQLLSPLLALLPLCLIVSVASVVRRYRRTAGARERLQIRCIAFGAALCIATYLVVVVFLIVLELGEDTVPASVLGNLALLAYTAIPVSVGVAILRHRLYDIDRIINRALVYGSVTALLLGAYVVLVLALQAVMEPLTEGSGPTVAISTLAAAALFRPVRTRVQGAVDRRFYRRRYDAARTLERFAARLRAQTDLEALRTDLTAVVHETMQPAHVSLWLREKAR